MKLENKNGNVPYLMVAGKDYVSSEMPLKNAEQLCANGFTPSDKFAKYPICVDNIYYFAGTLPQPKTEKREPTKRSK